MRSSIEITDYSFDADSVRILNNINLTVNKGEYVSIIGPNGAGKTTLLQCIMRIQRGGTGTILIDGEPLQAFSQRRLARTAAYIPQNTARFLPFSVEEFVLMGRYPHLSPFTSYDRDDRRRVEEALARTGVLELRRREMTTLSGGERQMTALAAALVQDAEIMLLDEPTAFLDPRHERDIFEVLTRLNSDHGITIVMVTHNINAAALHSHRVGIMKHGRFVYVGAPAGMMSNDILGDAYDMPFVFTGHPDSGRPVIVPEIHSP